jgi:hypothetical protein
MKISVLGFTWMECHFLFDSATFGTLLYKNRHGQKNGTCSEISNLKIMRNYHDMSDDQLTDEIARNLGWLPSELGHGFYIRENGLAPLLFGSTPERIAV